MHRRRTCKSSACSKHKPSGDTYISAMKDFDDKLGGLLSSLRNRGEFVGELGEAILFEPPTGSIVPSRVLVIGLGPESDLSLDTLRVVGRVALQEAVRLKAKHVSFAPTIRNQGNNSIDVGQGDRAVVENVILACDTEKRLQAQHLAGTFDIADWTVEAGPTFCDGACKEIREAELKMPRRKSQAELPPPTARSRIPEPSIQPLSASVQHLRVQNTSRPVIPTFSDEGLAQCTCRMAWSWRPVTGSWRAAPRVEGGIGWLSAPAQAKRALDSANITMKFSKNSDSSGTKSSD